MTVFGGWCRICGGDTLGEFDQDGNWIWSCANCGRSTRKTVALGNKKVDN